MVEGFCALPLPVCNDEVEPGALEFDAVGLQLELCLPNFVAELFFFEAEFQLQGLDLLGQGIGLFRIRADGSTLGCDLVAGTSDQLGVEVFRFDFREEGNRITGVHVLPVAHIPALDTPRDSGVDGLGAVFRPQYCDFSFGLHILCPGQKQEEQEYAQGGQQPAHEQAMARRHPCFLKGFEQLGTDFCGNRMGTNMQHIAVVVLASGEIP